MLIEPKDFLKQFEDKKINSAKIKEVACFVTDEHSPMFKHIVNGGVIYVKCLPSEAEQFTVFVTDEKLVNMDKNSDYVEFFKLLYLVSD